MAEFEHNRVGNANSAAAGENGPAYFSYWGKAKPAVGDQSPYHLLPYHCLDVAAVGLAYLSAHGSLLNYFSAELNVSRPTALVWVSYWLALHDLGKFSEAFQGQRPDLLDALQGRSAAYPYTERHDSLGQLLWQQVLFEQLFEADDLFGLGQNARRWREGISACMAAVTGHHGQPPRQQLANTVGHFKRSDEAAAADFSRAAVSLLLTKPAIDEFGAQDHRLFNRKAKLLSWWLAGTAVLADWLGSNTKYFPYKSTPMPLSDYWAGIQKQAKLAIQDVGVLPQPISSGQRFNTLFAHIPVATPLQNWSDTVALPRGPQLFLLEDVTGAGKTEAAVTLAYRLMAAGHASGLFVGLPTMATANAMYERIATVCDRLFQSDARPSLVLAHGQRRLSSQFNASVLNFDAPEKDGRQWDETATARCNGWLADNNKKSLLASVGVGTIDQALLAILHAKHQSLRLLGLFQKVLLVDEVHACDAYMLRLLERLLCFHAAAGGSAILLSATLPQAMKQRLISAFCHGRAAAPPKLTSDRYPLATQVSGDGAITEQGLATRPSVRRRVAVQYVDSDEDVVAHITTAIGKGQCVCWIRNTVADAMAAYQRLVVYKPLLFHARFAMGDRLKKEETVLGSFGPNSGAEQRRGQLVIATQVVEQSLDLDFDSVVSDLAPIDRMIQRAGRLCRHQRDASGDRIHDGTDARGEPTLLVFGPRWDDAPDVNWFRSIFPKAAYVYPHHGQLWLTARLLREGGFSMPEDARRLVESVFGDDAQVSLPEGLQTSADRAEGQAAAHTSIAHENGLKFELGYVVGDYVDWWRDADTPSRLGDSTTNVRLARWAGGKLRPWCDGAHAWAMSQVRVSQSLASKTAEPADVTLLSEMTRVLDELPDQGKWSALLPLQQRSDGLWTGSALDVKGGNREWQYCAELGLRLGANSNIAAEQKHEPD